MHAPIRAESGDAVQQADRDHPEQDAPGAAVDGPGGQVAGRGGVAVRSDAQSATFRPRVAEDLTGPRQTRWRRAASRGRALAGRPAVRHLVLLASYVAAGVAVTLEVWPDMIHAFPMFYPQVPASRQATEHAGAFMRRHMG